LALRRRLGDVGRTYSVVADAFAGAALAGLALALIGGFALSGRMLRRLRGLSNAMLQADPVLAPAEVDTARDELGELARAFAGLQQRLAQQEDARRMFVATASHELRTPLTSLQNLLELTVDETDPERIKQDVQQALLQAQRLSGLSKGLLDLSRLDAGAPLRSEPIELGELSRAVASEFGARAGEGGVSLDVVPPVGPCWASGDPGAVARVLRILLDNALRFSPAGSAIRVVARYAGDQACFEVADAGPGVPVAERELIFERFQRGSRTGGEGGFGLGLAIGRELAERLGGSLRLVDSDAGACFVCALPIELPTGSQAPEPAPAPA